MARIRPGDLFAVRDAEHVEGRVLRVDRDGLMVDWGGRLGARRHDWSDVGPRLIRLPRRSSGGAGYRSQGRRD